MVAGGEHSATVLAEPQDGIGVGVGEAVTAWPAALSSSASNAKRLMSQSSGSCGIVVCSNIFDIEQSLPMRTYWTRQTRAGSRAPPVPLRRRGRASADQERRAS